MALIVQKYGGSSLSDAKKISKVAKRIVKTKNKGNKVVVIVSAMGDTTDELIELSKLINPNPDKREMDMLLSTGEQVSIALVAMAIQHIGEKVISLTGSQAGIMTDSTYSKAKIMDIKSERLKKELIENDIIIVAGFQGVSETSDITTLGRGGSDTTAVAIAASLDASICEIYTDVDGVYSADPRIVPNAKKIEHIYYDDMMELAILGAKVLHPRCVELAKNYNVTIHLRSSFSEKRGTIIDKKENIMLEKGSHISGIAYNYNVVKLAIFDVPDRPGIARIIFNSLAQKNVNVLIILQSTSEIIEKKSISFLIDKDDTDVAVEILEENLIALDGKKIITQEELAIVSVVGSGLVTSPGTAARIFEIMGENNINIDMISTSQAAIVAVIPAKDCEKAVNKLAEEFNLVM